MIIDKLLGNKWLLHSVVSVVLGLGGFFMGAGIAEVYHKLLVDQRDFGLTYQGLEYSWETGKITQHIQIHGDGVTLIPATWTAEIRRGDTVLCSGSQRNNYNGEPKSYTPNEWTEDICPGLQEGDELLATWTYKTSDNQRVIIGGDFTITAPPVIERLPPLLSNPVREFFNRM